MGKSNGYPAEAFRNSFGRGFAQPRCLSQLRLSIQATPRWVPGYPLPGFIATGETGEVRAEPWHSLRQGGARETSIGLWR